MRNDRVGASPAARALSERRFAELLARFGGRSPEPAPLQASAPPPAPRQS